MCQVINLYGKPGVGKSTTAAGLFHKMKTMGLKVELVTEYAKELSYDGRFNVLEEDQLYVYAKQRRRMKRLYDQVDYIITDSPLLLSIVYGRLHNNTSSTFNRLVAEHYEMWHNINIFLRPNTKDHPYQKYGRNQTEEESMKIDGMIKEVLDDMVEYEALNYSDNDLIDEILDIIGIDNGIKVEESTDFDVFEYFRYWFDVINIGNCKYCNEPDSKGYVCDCCFDAIKHGDKLELYDSTNDEHLKEFIKENCNEFKPFAHYDKVSDILTVQLEDCSYYVVSQGIFYLLMKYHTVGDVCVGFSIKNPVHIFSSSDMTACTYNLVYVLTKIAKAFPNEAETCKYILNTSYRKRLGLMNVKLVREGFTYVLENVPNEKR